jgi:hypothetical protein
MSVSHIPPPLPPPLPFVHPPPSPQENDVLDEEIKSGPEGISGHGGGLLRRVLSRTLSQGSIKGSGPTHLRHSPRAKISPLPQARGVLKNRLNYDSPRKASAPAILSPSQQEILSSKSSTPSKPHRVTMAVLEEFDEQKRSSPRHSFFGGATHPQEPPSTRHHRATHRQPSTEQHHELNDEGEQHRARRATPRYADQEVGRQARISKRTSLSSLAEMGFVAPTPEKPMRYHNVIPARASLFMRQRSKHLSRDDIGGAGGALTSPSYDRGAGGGGMESQQHWKSHRGSSSAAHQRRRSLLSKRSQGSGIVEELKTFSYSDGDTLSGTGGAGVGAAAGRGGGRGEEENAQQLVTEIDGLMSQLTSIKRRLSQSSAEPAFPPPDFSPPTHPLTPAAPGARSSWRDRAFSAVSEEGLTSPVSSCC